MKAHENGLELIRIIKVNVFEEIMWLDQLGEQSKIVTNGSENRVTTTIQGEKLLMVLMFKVKWRYASMNHIDQTF